MRQTLAIIILASSCTSPRQSAPQWHSLEGAALGTTWSVRWQGPDAVEDAVAEAAVTALTTVDGHMSTWRETSELSRIRAGEGPVSASPDTLEVVRAALDLAQATDGAFDPTVQPLVELWGFHGEPLTTLPTDEAIEGALEQVGWERVHTGWNGGQPWIDAGGTALDLSAIAKGYAVDRVAESISALGVATHLVEVGGEVRVSGPGPDDGWWSIGVDAPLPGNAPGSELAGIVRLVNGAVATSGNYRRSRTVEGMEVHHTLDPRTGRPTTNGVGSATVTAPTCAMADGLATALMVMGPDGLRLIESMQGVEAGLLWVDDDGVRTESSSGFTLQMVTDSIQPGGPAHE